MAWRIARSLDVLRAEVRARYPGTTFWTIGDADHRDSWSDHNPNSRGVVCAADILDDGGMDLAWFAEHLRTSGHPALDYVIYRNRIAKAGQPWRSYGGTFHSHVHASVGDGPDGRATGGYDYTTPWGITSGHGSRPGGGSTPTPNRGGIMLPIRHGDTGEDVQLVQLLLTAVGEKLPKYGEDEDFGDETSAALRSFWKKIKPKESYDGKRVTAHVMHHLMLRAYGGEQGPRGPEGPAGKDGRDGVLKLPADIRIEGLSGRVTSLGAGE